MSAPLTLAVDLGGTKTLAALVADGRIVDSRAERTARDATAEDWIAGIGRLADGWHGRFERAGIAVTGVVAGGCWSALNPGVLAVPDGFPLVDRLQRALAVPVRAVNDAQAAAWGEFRHGAGRGVRTILFMTVSTGFGGGVVIDGRLLVGRTGIAGSLGQLAARIPGVDRLEDTLSGQWIAAQAAWLGHSADAAAVIGEADRGVAWAAGIVDASAGRLAAVIADLQYLFDPDRIVIGGGVGLASGYLKRLRTKLAGVRSHTPAALVPAALGADAGIVGAADLAAGHDFHATEEPELSKEEMGRCAG